VSEATRDPDAGTRARDPRSADAWDAGWDARGARAKALGVIADAAART